MNNLERLIESRRSRRSFLTGAGASLGAAALLTGCNDSSSSATPTPTPVPTPTPAAITDTDILNFALNLEYVEAEFYLRAATGSGLSAADAGSGAGTVTGGTQVLNLTAEQQSYVNQIAYDEQKHVQFLRSALGSDAVSRPALDLTNSFNALATAAGIGASFNPFSNFDTFLIGGFIFEDVGVTAYHGAAPLLSTTATGKTFLTAAAGILATEGYHAAILRTLITGRAIAGGASYPYLTYANQVSALRATLGGGNETPLVLPTAISPAITPSAIVAADSMNAIAFSRSTDQVLHIVYGTGGGAGVTKGGFFPAGLNGKITATAA